MEGQSVNNRESGARVGGVTGAVWPEADGCRPFALPDEIKGTQMDGGSSPQTCINHDVIRLALYKITGSPEFAASVQLRQFLTFVVEASIADPPVPLKGYTIATQALGRSDNFNPATDPIVRVEAARLRKRLEDYYAGTGQTDPVRIIIPKGSYQPDFHLFTVSSQAVNEHDVAEPASTGTEPQPAIRLPAARPETLPDTPPSIRKSPAFPAFLLHPAVFFPLMALAFAAGFATASL